MHPHGEMRKVEGRRRAVEVGAGDQSHSQSRLVLACLPPEMIQTGSQGMARYATNCT